MPTKPIRDSQGMIEGLARIDHNKPYLGNWDVVEGLIRAFVFDIMHAKTQDDVFKIVDAISLIFAGENPDYGHIPGWASRNGLGSVVSIRYKVDPDQNMVDILRTMFAKATTELFSLVKEMDGKPEEQWQWQVDGIIEFVTSILVGTVDTTHPPDEYLT